MPAKTTLQKARIATTPQESLKKLIEEIPGIPVFHPLDMEERDKLSSFLADPVFIKAWNNAKLAKPSVFPSMNEHFEGQHGDNRAAKQLARIQGWELFGAALINQTKEPVRKAKAPSPEFPEAGSLEAEVARNLPKSK